MLKKILFTGILAATAASNAAASDQIRSAGSSTVYPFVTVAAENFGRSSGFKTPIVESTGTGGGFKLFCAGEGEGSIDMANASRPIKDSEVKLCEANGIKNITEIKLGYDGIVLANSTKAPHFDFTKEEIFKALARKVPVDGKLVDNPYTKWSDINKSFPDNKIEVYGPPPTSGTRDAFVELVLEHVCESLPEFKAAYADKISMKKACGLIREDGAFIEAGENDNLIVQKLESNIDAVGIFGYSFLEENMSKVQGSSIDGVDPRFENISSGKYPVSRSLFVYLKDSHLSKTEGLAEFAKELVSDKAIGEDGYLIEKGLVKLSEEELANVQSKFK